MLKTNRDLYLAVLDLIATHKQTNRSLEQYIHTVLAASFSHAPYTGISLSTFFELLRSGFESELSSNDTPPISLWDASFGFGRWFSVASGQIRELRVMAEHGALGDPMRYFGVTGAGKRSWYNFDPLTFLECGAAGYFDGWRPGDPVGRRALEMGGVSQEPPEVIEIEGLYWNHVAEFFISCQIYE